MKTLWTAVMRYFRRRQAFSTLYEDAISEGIKEAMKETKKQQQHKNYIMKKVLLFALVALACSSIFANEAICFPIHEKDSVDHEIKEAFNKQFKSAGEVIWTKIGGYQKVSFKIDNYHLVAFYTFDREMVGYCRYIPNEQLPLSITMQLNKRFKDPVWFSNIIEVSNAEGNCYWLTVITRTESMRVQVNPQGYVERVFKNAFTAR